MRLTLTVLMIFFCLGCTPRPLVFETESTMVRIIEVQKVPAERSTNGYITTLIPIQGGGFFPITIPYTENAYVYTFRCEDGKVFVTQSTEKFRIGDCAKFWHPELAPTDNPKYNFVAGTLQRSKDCKKK